MKTICLKVNLSSAKTNILLDGRDTGLFTQLNKIVITGFYLRVDKEKVMLIIFSRENSLVSVCMTNIKLNFCNYCTIQKNVHLPRPTTDPRANSFHKEIKCVFCLVYSSWRKQDLMHRKSGMNSLLQYGSQITMNNHTMHDNRKDTSSSWGYFHFDTCPVANNFRL